LKIEPSDHNINELSSREIDARTLLLMELTKRVFNEDLLFKIVVEICKSKEITLRRLARRVGLSYSKTADKLQYLIDIGLIEYSIMSDRKIKLYRLSDDFKKLDSLLIRLQLKRPQ